ncbi:MAG: nucleotidyltransferase domain-containing protein [bacterium]
MKYGLKDNIIQLICDVFSTFPQVEKAVLYGSRAKGNFKNGSDIDLTLQGGEALTLNILGDIMDALDELHLPYSFDVSLFRDISDADLLEHIQRMGITFYEKPSA